MHCTRKVTSDLTWVGADDRRLSCFEGVYGVPDGVSYNSYLLQDEKTVLFDTCDKAVFEVFLENVDYALEGRKLDYLVIDHMEPDHAATVELLVRCHPGVKIVCNAKIQKILTQFFNYDFSSDILLVKEGDTLSTGRHELTFVMAPMVHWPEVMFTFDKTDGILFSADAFGTFGALNGRLFADETDFFNDDLNEARRYYTNIVGKYLEKYQHWSTYEPEEKGVLIAYASVYGHTANAANILACKLCDRGIKVKMYDTSVTPASYILSDAFKYSHLVFASTTYNNGIFVNMEDLLHDIVNHNLQNRKVAIIENGSWAPASGKLMREEISKMKNMEIIGDGIKLLSALKEDQLSQIDALADAIAESIRGI